MNIHDVKLIIQQLAKEEFNSYPDSYQPSSYNENVQEWAVNLWDCRTGEEVKRDFRLGLNVDFYILWAIEAFKKNQSRG